MFTTVIGPEGRLRQAVHDRVYGQQGVPAATGPALEAGDGPATRPDQPWPPPRRNEDRPWRPVTVDAADAAVAAHHPAVMGTGLEGR